MHCAPAKLEKHEKWTLFAWRMRCGSTFNRTISQFASRALGDCSNTRVQQQFSELQLLCEGTTYTSIHTAQMGVNELAGELQGTWSALGAGSVQPFTVKKERREKKPSGRLHHTEIENELCDGQRLIVRAQLFHCAFS